MHFNRFLPSRITARPPDTTSPFALPATGDATRRRAQWATRRATPKAERRPAGKDTHRHRGAPCPLAACLVLAACLTLAGCASQTKPEPKPRDLEREARMSRVFDAEDMVSAAQEHLRGGQVLEPEVAWSKLNQAIAAYPSYAKAYYLRAVVAEYLGDRAQALTDLDKAVALDPDNAKQLYMRGGFRMREGRYQEALDDFHRAAELEPNAPDAFIQMGVSAGAMGRFEEAADYFGDALARNPASASIYALRAKALETLGHNNEAMHDLTQAVSLAPGVPEHRLNRAWLARSLGDEARAKDDLEQALFLMPDSNGIRLAFSRFLSTSPDPAVQDPKRALKMVDMVVAMRGAVSPETYDTKALALAALKDFPAAVQAETNALKLLDEAANPNQAKAYRERLAAYQAGHTAPVQMERPGGSSLSMEMPHTGATDGSTQAAPSASPQGPHRPPQPPGGGAGPGGPGAQPGP